MKKIPWFQIIVFISILMLLTSSCSGIQKVAGKKVTVQIVYGSEKQEWLEPLVSQFNQSMTKTSTGEIIVVEAIPMGSIESAREIVNQTLTPTVWSPASSIYIPVINAEWRKTHSDDIVKGSLNDLVLSPVVIAMWKPMAEALGYPDKPIGWADISQLAISEEGWSAYGYPEWGAFKFGHTHPMYSNSGIVSIIAEAYAGANKTRGLTLDDLKNPALRSFMQEVESSIIHYGESTGFFAARLFERGPSYLSAAVLYENLVVAQQSKVLANEVQQIDIVAIYPKEGTFWSNHPYAILEAPWVTAEQREAAQIFEKFLLDRPQQELAVKLGFRPSPAAPDIPLTAPLDAQHGVDIKQPQTVLEIPSAEVIASIQQLWTEVKKPVDLVVVVDTSGSMGGKKITSARVSLNQFIDMLYDRDRIEVITFSSDIITLSPMSELGSKREELTRRVSGIIEGGDTRLYDAVLLAYRELEENGDPKHIRAVVVLSDGNDTASESTLQDVLDALESNTEEGGNAPKLFTIAYGDDADKQVLTELAEITGGKQYSSEPETIIEIYKKIATFF